MGRCIIWLKNEKKKIVAKAFKPKIFRDWSLLQLISIKNARRIVENVQWSLVEKLMKLFSSLKTGKVLHYLDNQTVANETLKDFNKNNK